MYRLDVTDRAEDDLDKIINYIAVDLSAPQAAADFADEACKCYDRLEENPFMFEACRDPKLHKDGYRRVVVKKYIIIYKVYEEEKLVILHRFFYGGQDYAKLI